MRSIDHLITMYAIDALGVFPKAISDGRTVKERTQFEEGWNAASFQILDNVEDISAWWKTIKNKNELHYLMDNDIIEIETDGKVSMWVNMNDTFCFACADSQEVEDEDLPEMVYCWDTWGWAGLIAFVAHLRHRDPIEPHINLEYNSAKKYLTDRKS